MGEVKRIGVQAARLLCMNEQRFLTIINLMLTKMQNENCKV